MVERGSCDAIANERTDGERNSGREACMTTEQLSTPFSAYTALCVQWLSLSPAGVSLCCVSRRSQCHDSLDESNVYSLTPTNPSLRALHNQYNTSGRYDRKTRSHVRYSHDAVRAITCDRADVTASYDRCYSANSSAHASSLCIRCHCAESTWKTIEWTNRRHLLLPLLPSLLLPLLCVVHCLVYLLRVSV